MRRVDHEARNLDRLLWTLANEYDPRDPDNQQLLDNWIRDHPDDCLAIGSALCLIGWKLRRSVNARAAS